jgi:hypothetical protein
MIHAFVPTDGEDIYVDSDDFCDVFFKYVIDTEMPFDDHWKYQLDIFKSSGDSVSLLGKDNIRRLRNFIDEMLKKE